MVTSSEPTGPDHPFESLQASPRCAFQTIFARIWCACRPNVACCETGRSAMNGTRFAQLLRRQGDEELATVRPWTGVGHRKYARAGEMQLWVLRNNMSQSNRTLTRDARSRLQTSCHTHYSLLVQSLLGRRLYSQQCCVRQIACGRIAASAGWTAQPNILYHEARYDPMKDSPSIIALLRELVEIMTGLTKQCQRKSI